MPASWHILLLCNILEKHLSRPFLKISQIRSLFHMMTIISLQLGSSSSCWAKIYLLVGCTYMGMSSALWSFLTPSAPSDHDSSLEVWMQRPLPLSIIFSSMNNHSSVSALSPDHSLASGLTSHMTHSCMILRARYSHLIGVSLTRAEWKGIVTSQDPDTILVLM